MKCSLMYTTVVTDVTVTLMCVLQTMCRSLSTTSQKVNVYVVTTAVYEVIMVHNKFTTRVT